MFLPREWWKLGFLWFANLKSRSPHVRRGLFSTSFKVSILSLAIGVGALSVTLAVVTGFEWTLAKAISSAQGHVVHVSRRWRSFEELNNFVSISPPGVERAEYFWNSQGLVVGTQGGRGILIEGRRPIELVNVSEASQVSQESVAEPYNKNENKIENETENKAEKKDDEVEIRLGRALAERIGAEEGSTVRLLLPGVIRGSVNARVTQLVGFGFYETDSRLAYVDDESLRRVLKKRDPESFAKRPGDGFGVRYFMRADSFGVTDIKAVDEWIDQYRESVLEIDEKESIHQIYSWRDQKASLFRGIGYHKKELTFILSLLTIVAALNIAATLVVLFLERDREMAILQALGMSPWQIFQWICIQGLMLGALASSLGVGLGRIFGMILVRLPIAQIPADIYNLEVLPLKYEFSEQIMVFFFGVGASLLAALVLGWRLSRINLVTVLGSRR